MPTDCYHIWEPSAGTGEFVDDLLIRYPNSKIVATEIEKELAFILRRKNIEVINGDTLLDETKEKYDLVIGNPPYYETKHLEKFKDVISGRANIFSFFIKLGLDALKPGGYLAFVVPPSMNNGAYFKKLREFIVKTSDIIIIKTFKEDEFSGAQQSVMVIVLQKVKNSGRFIFSKNGITIFTSEWESLGKEFEEGKTLKELGFSVITGTVVWNQHKPSLSTDSSDTLLIWSHNIGDGEIVLSDKKPQYIKYNKEKGPIILVNRIVGSVGQARIRAAIYEGEYVAENHVNVIIPQTEEAKKIMGQVCKSLRSEYTSNIAKKITGNVQISKTELQNLIPLRLE